MIAEVQERAAPIGRVLEAAADVDPDAAALLAKAASERLDGARDFAEHLASIDGLAPGVAVQQAADGFWALNDGTLYRRLVLDRGWSRADFTDWLAAQARACTGR
jgi:hypothetical protein